MHFVVIATDWKDENALSRRNSARPLHLQQAEQFHRSGKWLYAAGLLNNRGELSGSVIVCDFASKEALQQEWLIREPYILGRVWEKIEIHPAAVPPFILNG